MPGVELVDAVGGSCLALVPGHLAPTSTAVNLDVRILLDGATQATAADAVASMKKAYAPIGITVRPRSESSL